MDFELAGKINLAVLRCETATSEGVAPDWNRLFETERKRNAAYRK
jgi:hypothetical protein